MDVAYISRPSARNNQRSMFFGGYGYSNQQQNSSPSPTRATVWGNVYSPFRNTNMPLQDITMDSTLPLLNGRHVTSPGKTSPTGVIGTRDGAGAGRTMKEYSDQLEALKKENFNLKLRIYFMEERMGISSADDNASKKNIELKVELESLRKELVEKQELLSQAAKAFELIEEQKETSSRNQAQYQQSLEKEREKIRELEKELAEYQEKVADASIYYKEAFGITPEKALENEEKLHQMEELVASLEAEVKQVTSSLEEERVWAQELESERDEFRERLDAETLLRENLAAERVRDIEELREKVKELEEQLLRRDTVVQQSKNELSEKERIIKDKNAQLEEKCRAYEELTAVSEKKKKQVDQLRASIKSRDDALTDLNNKHRSLLSQFENGYMKRSPPTSPLASNPIEDPLQTRMGRKIDFVQGMDKRGCSDWEPNKERSLKPKLPLQTLFGEVKDVENLVKEVEEKDAELKSQEEARKQLVLKLCNVQKHSEATNWKLKKLEVEHEKAIKTIQGFMKKQDQLESSLLRKERKIMDLEIEMTKLKEVENSKMKNGHDRFGRRDFATVDDPERDHGNQQRFDEMEAKINNLRDEIESIKAEKNRLEKQIEVESEELQERLHDKDQKIEILEIEKQTMKEELQDKLKELDELREATATKDDEHVTPIDREELLRELDHRNTEIEDKNRKIDQLTKELQVKTQNLQKLVNTELWSKNKEIAKLHNHMTASHSHERIRNKSEIVQDSASAQLSTLVRELNDIGIRVTFTNEVIQLNYADGNDPIDVKTMTDYVQKLVAQKNELEKEVDYLKWLKLVSKPDIGTEIEENCDENQTEKAKKYCELLRTHLKDLVKFMKEMLKNADHTDTIGNEHKKIVLDVLMNSKILSEDFVNALEGISTNDLVFDIDEVNERMVGSLVKKSRSENLLNAINNQASTQSDSEAFSEPDRTVSMARIGLQETQQKSLSRSRFSKYSKTFTDSENSLEYVPYHKTYQNDLNDSESSHQIQELKETNALLYSELSALRTDLTTKISFDSTFDEKLSPLISQLEKSQRFCERLQSSLEKRLHEFHALKKESKQNSIRKVQLEKKLIDVENMAAEMTKQKADLIHYKENAERKTAELLITLNRENDALRTRIKKLEDENEAAKANISTLTKELDHLTLSHSQILVENTKLTNDKLRLEQELRKTESRCDMTVRSMHDKFSKEISDLNQINDSHRARLQELETANKELRRHVAVCEASDSAPSSSGVSSIPTDTVLKQTCDDIMQEYQPYNNSQYWLPVNYPTIGGRSKSSCSPDLGIESDAAVTTMRPLKDTLKITESMTNLLSDDDNANGNRVIREVDSESPLPMEGLDEKEALKHENEMLKRRLMKTRRALEDTFQHLSASNKNKKNVEKAITKQLQITKTILKKTRTYEEPLDN